MNIHEATMQFAHGRIISILVLVLLVCVSGCKDNLDTGKDSLKESPQNVLSNGGFETGDLTETANNAMGEMPWISANSGGNAIAASQDKAKTGTYSLKWSPIGWNTKDDGTKEDACTYILTNVSDQTAAGATSVRVSGSVETSSLDKKHKVNVILANDSFTELSFETILDGGREGWQSFTASMPLSPADKSLFLAFKVLGSASTGAPNSSLYLDDLSLVFEGAEETKAAKPEPKANKDVNVPAPPTATSRSFRMGFTPFPWDFSPQAVASTYEGIKNNGDIICHHMGGGVPWTEALADAPFPNHVVESWKTRKESMPAGTTVFLALSPLNEQRDGLALYHGTKENLPLPTAFQGKTFNDPDVIKAYATYCERAVEYFNPKYVALGIEVNNLIDKSPKDWPALVTLHKTIYQRLKKSHPDLPMFATVTLHDLFKENQSKAKPQQAGVKELLPYMDMVGLSFYPFISTVGDPANPTATFEWAREFFGDKPLAISETGYPAEPTPLGYLNISLPGTLQGQVDYTSILLQAAQRDEYVFVIEFLYRDYDALWERIKDSTPGWGMGWRDCGFLDGKGNPRPALEVWRQYFSLKYSPGPQK